MPRPGIGSDGVEPVCLLARRPQGVVIPEVADLYAVSGDVARNFVLRLVEAGLLERTTRRRTRPDAVEWARGAGGFIYTVPRRRDRCLGSRKRRAGPSRGDSP